MVGYIYIYIYIYIYTRLINLTKYSKDQDLEICAIKLHTPLKNIIIICLYRAPVGNFKNFLDTMEKILDLLHKPNTEFIICGDININYVEANNNRKSLNNFLAIYNLISTANFPTRIVNNSISMIGNIFIDASRNYTIEPYINGLSDHDAQILTIHNIAVTNITTDPYYIRNFNKNAITEFHIQLSWESWNEVFSSNDVNLMFNSFLNSYLRYHSSFIKKERKQQAKNNQWITKGIRISCDRKKVVFRLCRLINNQSFKTFYKKYCKILSKVILAAKRIHFNRIISNSENKIKRTWKIINEENWKYKGRQHPQFLKGNNKLIFNQEDMANIFNNYFLSVADLLNK